MEDVLHEASRLHWPTLQGTNGSLRIRGRACLAAWQKGRVYLELSQRLDPKCMQLLPAACTSCGTLVRQWRSNVHPLGFQGNAYDNMRGGWAFTDGYNFNALLSWKSCRGNRTQSGIAMEAICDFDIIVTYGRSICCVTCPTG